MDSGQLYRLGKRLIELSRGVALDGADPPYTPGELTVLEDVVRNPGSSVVDIHLRTGFVQSHVSTSVARLRERHLVETVADPTDGRRTRVSVTEGARRAIMARARRRVDHAIAEAVSNQDDAARAMALLEELSGLLK